MTTPQDTLFAPTGPLPNIATTAAPSPAIGRSNELKEAFLHVRVVDENGAERVPKGGDAVYLSTGKFVVVNGKTLSVKTRLPYKAADGFVYPLVGKDDIQLSIEFDGFESIQQHFRFEAPAKAPSLIPFWPESDRDTPVNRRRSGYLLACMDLNRAAGGISDQRSPKVFNLTVILHPSRIYVAVVGAGFWEDSTGAQPTHRTADFAASALTFADYLSAASTLNLSSPVYLLDCQRGRIERWDRIKGGGFRPHAVVDQRQAAPSFAQAADFSTWVEKLRTTRGEADRYLGARAIYRFMSELAQRIPGTVADFSIFSHMGPGGPLLFNTASWKDQTQMTRAEGDLDMHDHQDFIEPNVGEWRSIPSAFTRRTGQKVGSITGTIHVWGGFAHRETAAMLEFAAGQSSKRFRFGDRDLDRAGVLAELKQILERSSYLRRLATFCFGTATYGAPPGLATLTAPIESLAIGAHAGRGRRSGSIMYVPETTKRREIRALFESTELGSGMFNEFGYLLYLPDGMRMGKPVGVMQ